MGRGGGEHEGRRREHEEGRRDHEEGRGPWGGEERTMRKGGNHGEGGEDHGKGRRGSWKWKASYVLLVQTLVYIRSINIYRWRSS